MMPKPRKPTDFTESARRMTGFWQQLLRLQDWDIEFQVIRGWEAPETLASMQGNCRSKRAVLRFVDPGDWVPEELSEGEVEDTIVHELLHLHFRQAGYEYDEEKEEAVVHALAKVLVGLGGGS